MRNYVQEGAALDLTAPSGGVVAGRAYKIGIIICIATADVDAGGTFVGYVEGVYDVLAEGAGSGQAWAEGDLIYWDNTAKQFTKTATSNTKAGVAVAAKLTAATEGRLRLVPVV